MTSITQLLSPWPAVTKQSIVLREHYMPPPTDHMDAVQQHQHTPPSPSNDPPSGEGNGGDSDEGIGADGRKGYGKRELSTSKRAAQNRAAQVSYGQLRKVNVNG